MSIKCPVYGCGSGELVVLNELQHRCALCGLVLDNGRVAALEAAVKELGPLVASAKAAPIVEKKVPRETVESVAKSAVKKVLKGRSRSKRSRK